MILIYRPERAIPKRNAALYLENIRLENGENILSESQVEYVKSIQDSPDIKPLFDETALEWKQEKKTVEAEDKKETEPSELRLDDPALDVPVKTTKKKPSTTAD